MQTLATLILDGVLDRFPRLKFGVIEQGASWLPGLDAPRSTPRSTPSARTRSGCRSSRCRPSEYVRRQVRVTPYPAEDVGWIIAQARARRSACSPPTTRTSRAAATRSSASRRASPGASERAKQRFYCDNFVDLMGAGLAS